MTGMGKKKILRLAKGYYQKRRNCIRVAVNAVERAMQYSYIGRRQRHRSLRSDWIQTINKASNELNTNYNRVIYGLNHSNIQLDRKSLSLLAQFEPYSFRSVIEEILQQQYLWQERKLPVQVEPGNLVIFPNEPVPPKQELEKFLSTEQFQFIREDFEYTKPKRPTKELRAWMIAEDTWNSGWEDDEKDFFTDS